MPTTCPKCRAPLKYNECGPAYECGSWDRTKPERSVAFHQSDKCRIRELEAELSLWKPMTHEEAQAAYDAAEAVPMSEEEIKRIMDRVLDPAERMSNRDEATLVAALRKSWADRESLEADNARLRSSHKDLYGALRLYREAVQANGCPNDESTYGWLKDKLAELTALRERLGQFADRLDGIDLIAAADLRSLIAEATAEPASVTQSPCCPHSRRPEKCPECVEAERRYAAEQATTGATS
jgi:hypothetical protein